MRARHEASPAMRLRSAAFIMRQRARDTVGLGRTTAPTLSLVPYSPPPAAAEWHILDLGLLTRRTLRIVASTPRIHLADLDRRADLDTSVLRHVDELVQAGLVHQEGDRYTLTASGLRTLRTGREKGDDLLADRAEAFLTHFSDQLTTGELSHG